MGRDIYDIINDMADVLNMRHLCREHKCRNFFLCRVTVLTFAICFYLR